MDTPNDTTAQDNLRAALDRLVPVTFFDNRKAQRSEEEEVSMRQLSAESVLPTTTVRYADGDGINLGDAKNKEESFRKYATSLAKPLVTRETFAQYKSTASSTLSNASLRVVWLPHRSLNNSV